MTKTTVILHNNRVNTEWLIQQILSGTFGNWLPKLDRTPEVYSPKVLQAFIKEEEIHEYNTFGNNKQAIKTLSGGEQKKALFNYLVSKQPETLLLDNPYDHLDVNSQAELTEKLRDLSKTANIILLLTRKRDIPDFSSQCYLYSNGTLSLWAEDTQKDSTGSTKDIPPPITAQTYEGEYLIHFKEVSVSYESRTILNRINWGIKPGEFWQLTGPNGSGKTSLLSMITGDSVKGYGQDLFLFGHKKGTGESVWELKKKIGYFTSSMTQRFTGRDTAKEMIIGGFSDSVGLYQKPTDLQLKLAEDWLNILGEEYRNKKFCDLSLGQQRMVMITRAMVKHPLLLILDEPTTGLDDENTEKMTYFINKIAKESTTAILYVSHRKEAGLQAGFNYVLTPNENGSTGTIS